jgi:hypothetical protein
LPDVLQSLRAMVLFEQAHSELDHLIHGHRPRIFPNSLKELSERGFSSIVVG